MKARLDSILISSFSDRESDGGGVKIKHRPERKGKINSGGTCVGTHVLAKAKCCEENKHAGDKRGTPGQNRFHIPTL